MRNKQCFCVGGPDCCLKQNCDHCWHIDNTWWGSTTEGFVQHVCCKCGKTKSEYNDPYPGHGPYHPLRKRMEITW